MKRLNLLIIILLGTVRGSAQFIDAGPEVTNLCGAGSGQATLTAVVTPPGSGGAPGSLPATSYTISAIPYTPNSYTAGTAITFTGGIDGDDQVSAALPIGFDFCFFGNTYSQFYAGTDGWISFSAGQPDNYTSSFIPSAAVNVPKNSIMGAWQDWRPGESATNIKYATEGAAPNRKLIVSWNNVPLDSCTAINGTFQIVIYESSNVIENYISSKPGNCNAQGGTAVQGLHNESGTLAFTVPGRNSTVWAAVNEGWRYTPAGAATYTISWYTLPSNSLVGTGSSVTVSPLSFPQYYYAEVNGPNGCEANATHTDTVVVNSLAVVANAGPDTSICMGGSILLEASGGIDYSWSPATGLSDPSIFNPLASPATTTTYTVTVSDASGCTSSDSVIVNIVALPPVSVAASSLSICPGGHANLSASGATDYSWSPAASLVFPNTANPIASPSQTTVYTVTGTQYTTIGTTVLACSAQDTARVIVLPPPSVDAGPDTGICRGGSIVLNGSGSGTYSWSPSTGLSSTSIANPVANPDTTTTYTLTVMGAGFCTASSEVTITVNPNPVATAGPDTSICYGSSVMLSASGGGTYSWSPASGLLNSTSANPTASPGSTTQYIVTVSTAAGCTDKDTMVVNVNDTLSIGSSAIVNETCSDNNGVITVGAVTGGVAPYTYSLNGSPAQSTPGFSFLSQGTYIITVTDAAGCSETQVAAVGQIINTNASFTANPPSGPYPLIVNFTNTSAGATSYTWDFGNGTFSQAANPSAVYSQTGTYTVTLYASNGGAPCIDSFAVTINVFEETVFLIPNVFTPNGDNNNDVFRIQSTGLTELSGTIFNRWGNKLYEWSGDANSGWDGTFNGRVVEDGTYYYILKIKSADGTEKELKGYVGVFSN